MNILIYIPGLSQANGGIRQYSIGLLRLLSKDGVNKYFVLLRAEDSEISNIVVNSSNLKMLFEKKNATSSSNNCNGIIKSIKKKIIGKLKKNSFIDLLCVKYSIDIIHCPYPHPDFPYSKKAKLIATIHDIQEIHFPEYFTAEERLHRARIYLDYVKMADCVIVSYNHVKQDLIKYFNVDENKIKILLLDMNQLWIEKFMTQNTTLQIPVHLPQKFLLYPGNTWKHKNHLRLIEAIKIIKEKYSIHVNLICTGYKNDEFKVIEQFISDLELKNQIFFTGVVNEEVLFSLYKNCWGVIIPSTYEAGSFPLYESILMNVPVLCSNVTSLPETINNDEYLFDPFNVEEIAEICKKIWIDELFRNSNIIHLKKQAKKIRQSYSSLKLVEYYSELCKK